MHTKMCFLMVLAMNHAIRSFHTACLVAVISREKGDHRRLQKPTTTLESLFDKEGNAFLLKIFEGNDSSGNAAEQPGGESSADFTSYSRAAARRLMGMDEEYTGFIQLLSSEPKLVVADFDEDNLGLLRLSINLNPAMVARVISWSRSKYD